MAMFAAPGNGGVWRKAQRIEGKVACGAGGICLLPRVISGKSTIAAATFTA
jgi:hypothetical protein